MNENDSSRAHRYREKEVGPAGLDFTIRSVACNQRAKLS